jgi:methionyl-tRNA formyltransferase
MMLRVLLASSSPLVLPLLENLRGDENVHLMGIISTPDKAKGRHGTPTPNDLVSTLIGDDLLVWKPESHEELLSVVKETNPDVVLVVAYGRLLRTEALESVRLGWVNLHFSLLPEYRGAAPVQRAILNGDDRFGFTYFKIDAGMDTGAIYLQEEIEVPDGSSATEILELLAIAGGERVSQLLQLIRDGFPPQPQLGAGSLAPKIGKPELQLELQSNRVQMLRQVRAFTSSPGTWFIFNGKRCILTEGRSSNDVVENFAIALLDGKALLGTGDASIEILRIIPEGKREMSGIEWLRGLRLIEGESRRFGTSI